MLVQDNSNSTALNTNAINASNTSPQKIMSDKSRNSSNFINNRYQQQNSVSLT